MNKDSGLDLPQLFTTMDGDDDSSATDCFRFRGTGSQ